LQVLATGVPAAGAPVSLQEVVRPQRWGVRSVRCSRTTHAAADVQRGMHDSGLACPSGIHRMFDGCTDAGSRRASAGWNLPV